MKAILDIWWTDPTSTTMTGVEVGEGKTFHYYELTSYALVLGGKYVNYYHPWHTIARLEVTKP